MKRLLHFIEKYFIIFLLVIILIGGAFRFYNLTSNPPALNWDEVAIGYNAYSILKTGKDEFGKPFPVYFRSLNDYKRPVYIYATVGSIALFGFNDFAVRFPAAFFGTLTIVALYFLTYELLKNRTIALLSAFLLAIVPWHIQFSRAAFESTLGLFLTACGVLFSLRGFRRNLWYLVPAALCFGLSLYSYLGQRVAVPILLLTITVAYLPRAIKILKTKKVKDIIPLGLSVFIGIFFLISLYIDSKNPEGAIRYQATSIFTHSDEYAAAEKRMKYAGERKINLPRRFFHDNPTFTSFELVMRGYLTHFSPDFFFFDLGQEHHHAPGVGILYIWMLPFLMSGAYFVFKYTSLTSRAILFAWVLGAPIAGAVTFQVPHALRVAEMILPIQILIACGLYAFLSYVLKQHKLLFVPSIVVLLIIGGVYLFYYNYQYHVHLPHERSKNWVYGRKEAIAFAEKYKDNYDKVIVSTNLEFPHIFFLYYTQYDPGKYLAAGGTNTGSFDDEKNTFDRYEFHKFEYAEDSRDGNILFIGKPDEFPKNTVPMKAISYLNGDPAIYIVESERVK